MHPSRKPRVVLFFLIALCGFFVYSYTGRQSEREEIARMIEETRVGIAEAKLENQRLQAEYDYVTRPAYVDEVAREDLGFAKEGDRVIIVVDEDAPAAASLAGSAATTLPSAAGNTRSSRSSLDSQALPVWQQWLSFLADGPAAQP